MDQAIQTAYAKSFRGRLHAIATGRYVPLRLSKTHDRWNWGIAPQYDWLMAGGEEQSIHLDFAFDSQAHDRLHYRQRTPTQDAGPEPQRLLGFCQRTAACRPSGTAPSGSSPRHRPCTWRGKEGTPTAPCERGK